MTEEQSGYVVKRVDQLVKLSALALVSGKRQRHQIFLLSKAGFQPKEIAEFLGTTRNTVNVELSNLRRRGKVRFDIQEVPDDFET